jgi:hypothetical protein
MFYPKKEPVILKKPVQPLGTIHFQYYLTESVNPRANFVIPNHFLLR